MGSPSPQHHWLLGVWTKKWKYQCKGQGSEAALPFCWLQQGCEMLQVIHQLPKGIIPPLQNFTARDIVTAKAATSPFRCKTSQPGPVVVITGEINLPAGFHLLSSPSPSWRRNYQLPTTAQQLRGLRII